MTVEGLNLANARAIYFDNAGVKGKILRIKELPDLADIRIGSNGTASTVDLGPLPPRNQVTVEIDVDAEAEIGLVSFRLLTPVGTSPTGKFLIEPYYGESPDRERTTRRSRRLKPICRRFWSATFCDRAMSIITRST